MSVTLKAFCHQRMATSHQNCHQSSIMYAPAAVCWTPDVCHTPVALLHQWLCLSSVDPKLQMLHPVDNAALMQLVICRRALFAGLRKPAMKTGSFFWSIAWCTKNRLISCRLLSAGAPSMQHKMLCGQVCAGISSAGHTARNALTRGVLR